MTIKEAKRIMIALKCRKKCFYAFCKVGNKGVNGRVNKITMKF